MSYVIFRYVLQREYFKQGKLEHFRQILEEGSSPGMLLYYHMSFLVKLSVLMYSAIFYLLMWFY